MGAYYQWQLKEEAFSNDITVIEPDWYKFLESFFHLNPYTAMVTNFIKERAPQAFIVDTVCDYDENGNIFLDGNYKGNNQPVKTGYLVCDDNQSYISLETLDTIAHDFLENDAILISPLALLTRSSAKRQGGGDFDANDILNHPEQFVTGDYSFDETLISFWVGKFIHYAETHPENYLNLSDKLICAEK